MNLGAECLADVLLVLAERIDAVEERVTSMLAGPKENIQRFKKKLSSLKRSRRFVRWGESAGFARDLEGLLEDMKDSVSDPLTGAALVVLFYETDEGVIGNCDDSSGNVGDVYRFDAKDLFVDYASRCEDKGKIAKMVLTLNLNDNYGVRDALMECAESYLPETEIRGMISTLQALGDDEADKHKKHHFLILIELLARQIKDAPLFEQTRIAAWGDVPTAAKVDIARVYLESGDSQTAFSWLEKIPKEEAYQSYERDKLYLEIYEQWGDTGKLAEILFEKFKSYPSMKSLEGLLDVIGHDKKDEVVAEEVVDILAENKLRDCDAEFLIAMGKFDEAETYLLERADQLNGHYYESLLSFVAPMELEDRSLVASLIYRSLLDSILERGYTKAYPHGIRYLKKLDALAPSIRDWRHFDHHETYAEGLTQSHGKKHSFWSKYRGTK